MRDSTTVEVGVFMKARDMELLGARASLPRAPGIATRSILATSNKKLLVTKGIATRSKDATSSSWYY